MKRLPALLGLAALLAGCAGSVPAPLLLALPHAGDAAAPAALPQEPAPAPSRPAQLLVVRRVDVPEYMSSRRVRYRADPSTLAEWPNTYWAERIEVGVTREFVAALRQRLPGWTICEASCDDRLPALALRLDLAQLDYLRATQQLTGRARVAVSTLQNDGRLLQTREQGYALKTSADTPQAEAESITDLLRHIAALAAAAVLAAEPGGAPSSEQAEIARH